MKNQFVKISKLHPKSWGWNWRADQRILLIGLWFVAVGFDFGLKKSAWYKHFTKKCAYCEEPLRVNSRAQIVFFHGKCRTKGRALLRERERNAPSVGPLPWRKRIFA